MGRHNLGTLALGAGLALAAPAHAKWFASRVIDYSPAPGQLVNSPVFHDPSRALGPPVGGGTSAPNNSKLVSLGGFGGSITLGFDSRIPDLPPTPHNPHGLDLIVFGNAFWAGGNPNRRYAEPATIQVSMDVNGNGLADDPWYLIPGTHISAPAQRSTQVWDTDTSDPTYPPSNPDWLPPGAGGGDGGGGGGGMWTTAAFALPPSLFGAGQIITNPDGSAATTEGLRGYADCSPTLILGDTMGDNTVHDPSLPPERFYTVPDDPFAVGVTPGSGGGDAVDIAMAVDPATGAPAALPGIDFVRITTAINLVHPVLGEISTEIGGVARVRVSMADWDGNGRIEPADVAAFVSSWFGDLTGGSLAADIDGDSATTPADVAAFVGLWFAEV